CAFRTGRSTEIPALAYSYNFLPFTLTAEYMGGICVISPVRPSRTVSSCCRVIFFSSVFRSTISPVASSVSVEYPIATSASYVLHWYVLSSSTCVVLPMQNGNTPSTSESSVPVWPTFLVFKILRSLKTQSWEVMPFSFHKGRIPLTPIYVQPL